MSSPAAPATIPEIPTLSPGYLPLERLLVLYERLADPPPPWPEHPGGLAILRRTVEIELRLRAVTTGETAPRAGAVTWPDAPPPSLLSELEAIGALAGGRIPPPRRITELWAQHKYSVVARSPGRGREIGSLLGRGEGDLTEASLLPELVDLLRTPPSEGTLRDAVMHMWGYVSPIARTRGLSPDFAAIPETIRTIGEIALEEPQGYLAISTAISDLAVWGNGIPSP